MEPLSLWLPGLFNPMAFVTAIMQVTARATGLPLDKMSVETHVTTMLRPEVSCGCCRWCGNKPVK